MVNREVEGELYVGIIDANGYIWGSAETDDVISNGLGGLIGVAVAVLVEMWIRSRKEKKTDQVESEELKE